MLCPLRGAEHHQQQDGKASNGDLMRLYPLVINITIIIIIKTFLDFAWDKFTQG